MYSPGRFRRPGGPPHGLRARHPARRPPPPRRARPDAPSLGLGGFVVVVLLTFLGLLAITFFIGRVVPIDPVLAVVGDRATPEVYEAARIEMGLDRPLDRAVRLLRAATC